MDRSPLVYGLGDVPVPMPKHRVIASARGCCRGACPMRHWLVLCACRRAFTGQALSLGVAQEQALTAFYDHVLDRENEGDQ